MSLRPGRRPMASPRPAPRHVADVDVVHVVEERLRLHAVHLHHAGQRGAELAIVGFLQIARVGVRHVEEAGDELAHAVIDLGEQVARGRIKRVVEVEHPHARVGERSLLPDLHRLPAAASRPLAYREWSHPPSSLRRLPLAGRELVDAGFDDGAEVLDQALHGPGGGFAERADGVAFDLLGDVPAACRSRRATIWPRSMRCRMRHSQPVPSRHGVHWPQLSCL